MIRLFSLLLVLSSINSIAQTNISGLMHHWSFDGDATASHGDIDAVPVAGASLTTGKEGQSNTAYYLHGNNDAIRANSLNLNSDVTISFWIKPDINSARLLSTTINYSASGLVVDYKSGNIKVMNQVLMPYPEADQSNWTHLSLTFEYFPDRALKYAVTGYINGVKHSTVDVNFNWSTILYFGAKCSYRAPFEGSMDEVKLFNRVLTDSEVQSLYTSDGSGSGGDSGNGDGNTGGDNGSGDSGLMHHWSFDGDGTDSHGDIDAVPVAGASLTTGKEGQSNTAYYLHGNNDAIRVSPLNLSSDVTISFWIKSDSNKARLLSTTLNYSASGLVVDYQSGNVKVMNQVLMPYPEANQSNWTHLSLTFEYFPDRALKYAVTGYIDGVKHSTVDVNFNWSTALYFGAKGSYRAPFEGSMDEVKLFNKVLTDSQIQSLYTSDDTGSGSGGNGDGNSGTPNDGGSGTSTCESIHCADGKVGIGTTTPDMMLTVKGKIHAEEMKIDLNIPAPDYVFKSDYNLRSIEEVEAFIEENSHLPEIPSAKEFAENGVMQAEMDMHLLKKIEELTLYTIEQQKEIDRLKAIEERLNKLEKLLEAKE